MATMRPNKPETQTTADAMADSITALAAGMKELRGGRLTDKAVVLLLHHASGVSQRDIRLVLDSLASLETTYLRKRPA